jgi:hypothetical protein
VLYPEFAEKLGVSEDRIRTIRGHSNGWTLRKTA